MGIELASALKSPQHPPFFPERQWHNWRQNLQIWLTCAVPIISISHTLSSLCIIFSLSSCLFPNLPRTVAHTLPFPHHSVFLTESAHSHLIFFAPLPPSLTLFFFLSVSTFHSHSLTIRFILIPSSHSLSLSLLSFTLSFSFSLFFNPKHSLFLSLSPLAQPLSLSPFNS